MTQLELLLKSIETRKPISFEYNKEGKTNGIRIGNLHAIYIFTPIKGAKGKKGTKTIKSTKLDLVQTSGVTDSPNKPLPDFRRFNIEDISSVVILEDEPNFEIFTEKYNPEWDGYNNVIAKV
jgi:hypothetical protein